MPYRIFLQTFPHLKVDLQTKVSMAPSPRLVFQQVLEYLLQKNVNTGLKSWCKSGCKSNKGDCYILLQTYCRKLFMYLKWQRPLLHKWLYATLGRRQRAYGLEKHGWDNPSCPSGKQSHEAMWLPEACQSMTSFLHLCWYSSFFPDKKRNSLPVDWTLHSNIQRTESAACFSGWSCSPAGDLFNSKDVPRGTANEIFPKYQKDAALFWVYLFFILVQNDTSRLKPQTIPSS